MSTMTPQEMAEGFNDAIKHLTAPKAKEPPWAKLWSGSGQGWSVDYFVLEQHTRIEINVEKQCAATLFNPDVGIEVSAGQAVWDTNRCWLRAGNAKLSVTMAYAELLLLKDAIVVALGLNISR